MTMNTEPKNAAIDQSPSAWQKFLMSVSAFAKSMDYDPHEYAALKIDHVWQELEKLELRVSELEERNR